MNHWKQITASINRHARTCDMIESMKASCEDRIREKQTQTKTMKTLPLSEVLAGATPLPWKITNLEADGHYDVEGNNGAALVASGAGFYGEDQPQEANAALLCHAANMLPELVEALQSLLDTTERFRDDLEALEGYTEKPDSLKLATETLSRARAVPMP